MAKESDGDVRARGQKPVAWCVRYDDPRFGAIHSDPTMYKPRAERMAANAQGLVQVANLYTTPQPTYRDGLLAAAKEASDAIAQYSGNEACALFVSNRLRALAEKEPT